MSKVPNEPKIELSEYEWRIEIRPLRIRQVRRSADEMEKGVST